MRDFKLDSRLLLIAGFPLVALGLLSGGALSAAAGTDPAPAIRTLGVIGLVTVAVSLVLLVLIGPDVSVRSDDDDTSDDDTDAETGPGDLDAVVAAAEELANSRLPALVKSLGDTTEAATPASFDLDLPDGPIGDLGRLINGIQASAYQAVAVQHDTIQARLGDLVINLVRRNQSLLDRQLESIDELETSEENPSRLEQLYSLDLLATRMRRNADSLLVLAGSEPPRRRNGPVSTADIVRVAVSEIENYRQVGFAAVDEAMIAPAAVVDVAHLLSELLENATTFSPPDASVTVEGRLSDDGYEITVTDIGIGLSPDQADGFNQVLAQPPGLSFDMSRTLGFMVVGRLAQRHGIDVVLTPGSPVGTKAEIRLPASLLVDHVDIGDPALSEPTEDNTTVDDEPASLPLAVRSKSADDLTAEEPVTAPVETATAKAEAEQPAPAAEESAAAPAASSDALARLLGLPSATDDTASDNTASDNTASSEKVASADPATPAESDPAPSGTAKPTATAGKRRKPAAKPAAKPAGKAEAAAATNVDAFDADAAPSETDTRTAADSTKADSTAEAAPAKRATKRKPAAKRATKRKPAAKRATPRPKPAAKPQAEADIQPATDEQPTADTKPTTDDEQPTADTRPATEAVEAEQQTESASAEERPASLDDAVPTGATFDAGIEALLDPGIKIVARQDSDGSSGLKKRDRSKSYAPAREGREIPGQATAAAATASSRKPDEIRSMIARYREARNRPIEESTDDLSTATTDENGADS